MEKVTSVTPLPDGYVSVVLQSGAAGTFDVKPYMGSSFFAGLKDATYFKQVRLVFRGVGWPDGQDIGPDTIAAELVPLAQAA